MIPGSVASHRDFDKADSVHRLQLCVGGPEESTPVQQTGVLYRPCVPLRLPWDTVKRNFHFFYFGFGATPVGAQD